MAFTAYFDDSGGRDTIAIVAGGFVVSTQQAIELERNWNDTLKAFGIRVSHMRDFSHSQGDFAKWKGHQSDQRIAKERNYYFNQIIGHTIVRARRVFSQGVLMRMARGE